MRVFVSDLDEPQAVPHKVPKCTEYDKEHRDGAEEEEVEYDPANKGEQQQGAHEPVSEGQRGEGRVALPQRHSKFRRVVQGDLKVHSDKIAVWNADGLRD